MYYIIVCIYTYIYIYIHILTYVSHLWHRRNSFPEPIKATGLIRHSYGTFVMQVIMKFGTEELGAGPGKPQQKPP